MNLKIIQRKILIYKIKIYGDFLNIIKKILLKHNINFIRSICSTTSNKLTNLYNKVLEKDEGSSLY